MTTTEYLQRIRAKCVELLDIASTRMPGKWQIVGNEIRSPVLGMTVAHGLSPRGDNALFIASCAGAAEAGWHSTIAAIDGLLRVQTHGSNYVSNEYDSGMENAFAITSDEADETINTILAAWPKELLQ